MSLCLLIYRAVTKQNLSPSLYLSLHECIVSSLISTVNQRACVMTSAGKICACCSNQQCQQSRRTQHHDCIDQTLCNSNRLQVVCSRYGVDMLWLVHRLAQHSRNHLGAVLLSRKLTIIAGHPTCFLLLHFVVAVRVRYQCLLARALCIDLLQDALADRWVGDTD
jgi:hypothetical protein